MSRNKTKVYIGLTEHPYKQRYSNHMESIRHEEYGNSTELLKHVWQLRKAGKEFKITWSINLRAQAYSNITKRCNLCLTEKLPLTKGPNSSQSANMKKVLFRMFLKGQHTVNTLTPQYYITNLQSE